LEALVVSFNPAFLETDTNLVSWDQRTRSPTIPMTKSHIYERAFDLPEASAFVVDDEPQVRAFVSNVLSSAGLNPYQFANGGGVTEALAQIDPQIIVLDLSLGDSDAIEVIRILVGTRYHGDVLLISGHDPLTVEEVWKIGEARGLNMLTPLRKPFRVTEFKQRIEPARKRAAQRTEANLASALKNNWLELWYQPKVALKSMQVKGAEALIRLRHPEQGIVPPSRFLPPPGDPLYVPLTEFVIQRALSDWSDFAGKGIGHRLAINVPASVMQRPDFVPELRKALPKDPEFPGLIVEITEDEAISNPVLAREVAIQLRLYNVLVSIDDFGSGFSSLARLKELPFTEIKLDRSYVRGCAMDAAKRKMCVAVVDLARKFEIAAVAEGVETADDLSVLVDSGYDMAQGFFFARPMTSTDFVSFTDLSRDGVVPLSEEVGGSG
jgi:EAL domain-containing protein (putative c-di-GMP-specific phosphodiesterase class I)/CheY-like chemotaxis protein